ncbi:MAG: acyl-CoA dehydrogenase [Acidimicrobiaceae bacterium]|nr:acyl-CoA dehydrogenase [Acidimicrobiaceae bacterium]|tara:strand:+ start:887 stop:2128 length:1242 start_codon:yes stop_codon:yes gene_type:complete
MSDLNENDIRISVRQWLSKAWDPTMSLLEWRTLLVDSRWAVPSWPEKWFGRAYPAWADDVVRSELLLAGTVATPVGASMNLAAPTIMKHGGDKQKQRFLRPALTGEETWCQLFSEPSAGSDLAGLGTHAELDGDEWIVTGQKVWNTSAHHADLGLLVARTDWDSPKHKGLTYFALPMNQKEVEVRPLMQMNRHTSFNEVFMTEARIPNDYVIGTPGEGWAVALTTLAFERGFGSLKKPRYSKQKSRVIDEAKAESEEHFKVYSWYPQRAGRVDLTKDHARTKKRNTDPIIRQEIAKLLSMHRIGEWTASRARAARKLGRAPGAEGSIGKLMSSNVARQANKTHSMIAGASALLTGPSASYDGIIAEILVSTPAKSIAGGTDEIQRNIIGERVLGLPREPSTDKDVPFRDVPRN